MTLFNFKYFELTKAELCLKDTSVNSKFQKKSLLTLPVPTMLKQLIQKKSHNFDASKSFYIFEAPKWSVKTKRNYPLFQIWKLRVKTNDDFVELTTYTITVYLTREIRKNNSDTCTITNRQYYKNYISKSFYQTKLTFSESYCQVLEFFPGKFY